VICFQFFTRYSAWFLPEEDGHAAIAKGVADIVRAGGKAGLGSHGQGLGAHWETWNLQSGGLTPHETLRVVTLFGAEAIGRQQDVGCLRRKPWSRPSRSGKKRCAGEFEQSAKRTAGGQRFVKTIVAWSDVHEW
jgi:hypothetical protein